MFPRKADSEHVDVVRGGTESIRVWRARNPGVKLLLSESELIGIGDRLQEADLSGADLRATNLGGADLSRAKLNGADLGFANLRYATLSHADLSGAMIPNAILVNADFSEANLHKATLSLASLRGADVSNADLSQATLSASDLYQANLNGASLQEAMLDEASFCRTELKGTDFSEAVCAGTVFSDVDLSSAVGLDRVVHSFPSSIGIDTLYRFQGKIPQEFLREAGVPDALIANVSDLIGALEPIQFYSCFISYSHKDEDFCQRLHSRMRDNHLRVWYAPEDMKGGEKIHEQIDQAIRVHDKLLLVLSETSMNSEWVATEIYKARRREMKEGKRVLFPISLVAFEKITEWERFDADTGTDMARAIREYFIPDFTSWKDHDAFEDAFAKLVSDLKTG